jgi:hypothetical protein
MKRPEFLKETLDKSIDNYSAVISGSGNIFGTQTTRLAKRLIQYIHHLEKENKAL